MNIKHLIKIAAKRKKIPETEAEKELKEIFKISSRFDLELALRHYFEDQTHPNHNDYSHLDLDPILNFKE